MIRGNLRNRREGVELYHKLREKKKSLVTCKESPQLVGGAIERQLPQPAKKGQLSKGNS